MISISNADFIRIKRLFENSEYLNVINTFESIISTLQTYSMREQAILKFYYLKSLNKENLIQKITDFNELVKNEFFSLELGLLEKLIYFLIIINAYDRLGNINEQLTWYNNCKRYIDSNKYELSSLLDNYWYYYSLNVSATIEMKQKNYTQAYDMLKHNNNHFLNIKEKSNTDKLMLASISFLLGDIHKQTNFLTVAINDFKNTIEWGLEAHNLEYIRGAYLNLALTYEEQGEEYLAVQTVKNMIQQINTTFDGDEFSLSSAYNLLGNIYNRIGEFVLAKNYYLLAFSVITDSTIRKQIQSYNFNNMGVISFKLGSYAVALDYYLQALELAIAKQDSRELAYYYTNIGEVYLELNRLDNALESELQALNYLELLKNADMVVETYFILVRICLEQKDFDKADFYINKIKEISLNSKKRVYEFKYNLSLAIKLKKELKFEKSKEIFLSLIANPSLTYDLQIIAMTELAGMLLYSIVKFKNNNYEDLEKIALNLMSLGKQKNSLPVICHLSILLARIKMMTSRYDSAENILNTAFEMCVTKDVDYFKKKIQNELDFLQEIRILNYSDPETGRLALLKRIGSSEILRQMRELQRLMRTI